MPKYKNVTGQRFGRLTAIQMVSMRPTKWLYRCDCGNEKILTLGDVNSDHVRSCGCLRTEMVIAFNAKKKLSLAAHIKSAQRRIEERSIPEPNSGCWLWLGSVNSKGYGTIGHRGGTACASRLSYAVFVCDPGDLFVLHRCDVPACVNPEHLFTGTQQENIDDCRAKGRFRPGGILQPPT